MLDAVFVTLVVVLGGLSLVLIAVCSSLSGEKS
jgi:hypothetical protein